MYLQKVISRKTIIFFSVLKVTDENSRIRIRIWIRWSETRICGSGSSRTKMSRIHNSVYNPGEKGTDLLERGVSPLAPHSPFFLARAGLVEEGGRGGRGSPPPRPSPPSSCSSPSPSSQHVWKDLSEQKEFLTMIERLKTD
jgi:hypothetical protein